MNEKIVAEIKREQVKFRRAEKDYRLRNTKILLREYRKLKTHVEIAPEKNVNDDEYKLLTGGKQSLDTLVKYKISTEHLLQYIDCILYAYKNYCKLGNDIEKRRWDIIDKMYLAPKKSSMTELSKRYNLDHSVISRNRNKGIQDLSIMLFGVWGLDDFFDTYLS